MNYENACAILGIDANDELNEADIKRHYRAKALQYHPDKNHSSDASAKFQEIHESYDYLLKYYNCPNRETKNSGLYSELLFSFLKNILHGETKNTLYHIILERIINKCEEKAIETMSLVDKNTLLFIYDIVKKYGEVLHISDKLLDIIEKIISDKIKNDECIILNPTINDLFENNLYKLTINGISYIVPLWHHELVYDNSGNDIYVKCNPIVADNIEIDNKNNIHVNVEYHIYEIWEEENVVVNIGNKKFILQINLLKLTTNQTVLFAKQGISKINNNDIYDVTKLSDVYVNIKLHL